MKKNIQTRKDNEAIWTDRLKAAREFSGTVNEFCTENAISYPMLKYWRNKLEGKGAAKRAKAILQPAAFVRVEPTHQASPKPFHSTSGAHFVAEVLWHISNRMEVRL